MKTNLLPGLPSLVVKFISYIAYLQSSGGKIDTNSSNESEFPTLSVTIIPLSILYMINLHFTLPNLTSLNWAITASSTLTPK